mmetsp:Transcript_17420/g.26206  ORF Transcript_17420/g.26206 Transcript_17420/m.26206 type:complete len:536 (+) Transcript_17420:83-1690(+)
MGTCSSKEDLPSLSIRNRKRLDASMTSASKFSNKYDRSVHGSATLLKEMVLGQGSFGKVVLCEEKKSKATRALKIIKKHKGKRLVSSLNTEILALRACGHHEHILQLYDVYETGAAVLLVLELATGGDLLQRVTARPEELSEQQAASAIRQICQALAYCHSHDIIHRDIKPENILLKDTYNFHLKLADFGCSKILPTTNSGKKNSLLEPIDNDDILMTSFVGTKAYAAPEILRHEPYGPTCDIYSTGVVLALLLTGRHPLSDVALDTNLALASADVSHLIQFDSDPSWKRVSTEARQLVELLAHTNPKQRPSIAHILEIPWIKFLETQADASPLTENVVHNLKQVRFDALQHLVLTALVGADKITASHKEQEASLADTVKEADTLFDALDADRTGVIRRNELHNAIGNGSLANDLDAAFDVTDFDGSGLVDRYELRAAFLAQQGLDNLLHLAFATMDVSHSGNITPEDVVRVAKSIGLKHISTTDVKAWIQAHDLANDGYLTFDEFSTMMLRVNPRHRHSSPLDSRDTDVAARVD